MNARTALAQALGAALPDYRVLGYTTDLDAVTRPTVMLWQALVERADEFGLGRLKVTLELWVLVGAEDPAKVDDALDDALDDVLDALQGVTWVDWTTCERGVLLERHHGYRITALAVAQIGA